MTSPAPNKWKEAVTADGKVYYFNTTTKETRWERTPDMLVSQSSFAITPSTAGRVVGDWKEAFTSKGRKYYYNGKTRETRWEAPEGFEEALASQDQQQAQPQQQQVDSQVFAMRSSQDKARQLAARPTMSPQLDAKASRAQNLSHPKPAAPVIRQPVKPPSRAAAPERKKGGEIWVGVKQEEHQKVVQEKGRLEQELKNRQQELKQTMGELNRYREGAAQYDERLKLVSKQYQQQQAANRDLQATIDKLQEEMRQLQDAHQQQTSELEKKAATLSTNLKNTERTASVAGELEQSNAQLQSELTTLKQKHKDIQLQLSTIQSSSSSDKQLLDGAMEERDNVIAERDFLQLQLSKAEGDAASLQIELDTMRQALENTQYELQMAQAETERLAGEILEATLSREDEMEELKNIVLELGGELPEHLQ